jgi:DNA polymerase-3 subunit alpha
LKKAPGPCPVYLSVRDRAGHVAQFKLNQDFCVDPNLVRVEELEMMLEPGAVLYTGR